MPSQEKTCHLWRLPLELRQTIYDLAYGRGKQIELVNVDRLVRVVRRGGQEYTVVKRHEVSRA